MSLIDLDNPAEDRLYGRSIHNLSAFFDYPTQRYTVKYGFRLENGKYSVVTGGCHGFMANLDLMLGKDKPTHYISCLRAYDNGWDTANKYWDKLFDPTGPYKDVLTDLEFHYDKAGRKMAFSVSVNPKTSTQLLVNLAINARLPFEYPERMTSVLHAFGHLPSDLFLFVLATVASIAGTECTFATSNPGHFGFDPGTSLELLRKGTPKIFDDLNIGAQSLYYPNNAIWAEVKSNSNTLRKMVSSKSSERKMFFEKYARLHPTTVAHTTTVKEILDVLA